MSKHFVSKGWTSKQNKMPTPPSLLLMREGGISLADSHSPEATSWFQCGFVPGPGKSAERLFTQVWWRRWRRLAA